MKSSPDPSVESASDHRVCAPISFSRCPPQGSDYIGLGPRSSGPFGGPVGESVRVADDFPVGDFTPGTKEGPEGWKWVELGPAPCGCLGARAYCLIVLVCPADAPRGALNECLVRVRDGKS